MIDMSEETDLNKLFYNCTNLIEIIGIENWNVSKVWTFHSAFTLCQSLTSLDLSKWDASSLTDTSQMFNCCTSLISLNIGNWDTSNITQMEYIFAGDSSLVDLNMSNWDIRNILDHGYVGIFDYCDSLDFGGITLTDVDYTSYSRLEARYIGRAR
jgi:surface protein